jgi:hypothetical protein
MHSYIIDIYKHLLTDVRILSGVSLDAPVDISYSWLLIEAPLLEKEILLYLEGRRDSNIPLPLWLMPLWSSFLNGNDAQLKYIRQVLLFCYKAEHEPTDEQLKSAQADFEETEALVKLWSGCDVSRPELNLSLATARRYVSAIIYRINWSEITPSHGPGGIFPSRKPWDKSRFRTLYSSINRYYPFDQFFHGLPSFWWENLVRKDSEIEELDEIVCSLVAVPKDSRGPRIICVHPAEAIWIQQGQRRLLEASIERHPLTRGKINFTDQTVNGRLAMSSSIDQEFCTLDLKEASDRISKSLVKSLFGDYAYDILSCSRATKVRLLDGRVIGLEKWAPMGNCLTFPIESLVFWSLVRAGIYHTYGITCNDVYVFGDDIIFPRKYYDGAIRSLVMAGLVPNYNKTFRKGFFRESCGVDAYKGIDVTPLRLRRWNISSLDGIISLQSLAKRLRLQGFYSCAEFIYSSIRQHLRKLRIGYPINNNPDAGGLFEYLDTSRTRILRQSAKTRINKSLQKAQVRVLMVSGRVISIPNGDWYHLQDSLLRLELCSNRLSDRCTEYAVPYRTRLHYGWADCL